MRIEITDYIGEVSSPKELEARILWLIEYPPDYATFNGWSFGFLKSALATKLKSIQSECYDPLAPHYMFAGKLGAEVAAEWMGEDGVLRFVAWSLANGYCPGATLRRRDRTGDFIPSNLDWVEPEKRSRKHGKS